MASKRPGRPGIDYEDVRRFMDEFIARHDDIPSIAAIIQKCGGSTSTITKFRHRYIAEAEGVPPGGHALPEPLTRSLDASVRAAWKELLDGLAAQEQALEARFADKAAVLEQSRHDAAVAQREAEQRAELLEQRYTETHQELTAVRDLLTQTEKTLAAAERDLAKRNATLKARDAELVALAETHDEVLAAVKARLTDTQAARDRDSEEFHKRIADQERQYTEAMTKIQQRIDQLTEQLAGVTADRDALAKARARAETALEERSERLTDTEQRLQTTERAMQQLDTKLRQAQADLVEAQTARTAAEDALERLRKQHSDDQVMASRLITEKDQHIDELRRSRDALQSALDARRECGICGRLEGQEHADGCDFTGIVGAEPRVIYFLQGERTQLVKIGYTTRPIAERLTRHQGSSPDTLHFLGACPGDRVLETELHHRYAPPACTVSGLNPRRRCSGSSERGASPTCRTPPWSVRCSS